LVRSILFCVDLDGYILLLKIDFSRLTELWNLDCDKITEYCSTWRKALRRIWELPYKFRSDYLSAILGTSPIYDELCRRLLNFITTCNSSDSKLIRFVLFGTQFIVREVNHLLVVITCCVTRDMVPRLKTNLRLVSNLHAVVTSQWSCLLPTAVVILLLLNWFC